MAFDPRKRAGGPTGLSFVTGPLGGLHVEVPYYFAGGKPPFWAQQFIKAIEAERAAGRVVDPNVRRSLFDRYAPQIAKTLLIATKESQAMQPTKSFQQFTEGLNRRLPEGERYKTRLITAKVQTSPFMKRVDGIQPEMLSSLDANNPRSMNLPKIGPEGISGYYHLHRNDDGTFAVFMDELTAGHLAIDMDADRVQMLIRERNGKQWATFLKEPMTQAALTMGRVTDTFSDFKLGDLFSHFRGPDTGVGLTRENYERYEKENRVWTLFGNARRLEDAAEKENQHLLGYQVELERNKALLNRYGVNTSKPTVSSIIAEKQLTNPAVGINTNLMDTKAIYDALQSIDAMKEFEPEKWESRVETTMLGAQQLLNAQKEGRDTRVLANRILGGGRTEGGSDIEAYLGNFIRNIAAGDRGAAEELARITYINQSMFDDKLRLYAIEAGMKSKRVGGVNVKGIEEAINYRFNNNELLFKTNSITELGDKKTAELMVRILNGNDHVSEMFRGMFGAANKTDFEQRSKPISNEMARFREGKRFDLPDVGFLRGQDSTLRRLVDAGVIDFQELGVPEGLDFSHIPGAGATAMVIRDPATGLPIGPYDPFSDRAGVATFGGVWGHNKYEYIASRLEEEAGGVGFGALEGDMEHGKLVNILRTGGNGQRIGVRNQIALSYGLGFDNLDELKNMAIDLEREGPGSSLHKQIAMRYYMQAKERDRNKVIQTVNNIVADIGGRTNVPSRIDDNGRVTVNPADIRVAATTIGADTQREDAIIERKIGIAEEIYAQYGGVAQPYDGASSGRMIHFVVGEAPGSFTPLGFEKNAVVTPDTAMRSAKLQKQLGGGGVFVKDLRVAYVTVDGSNVEEFDQLLRLYGVGEGIGPKKIGENIIVLSKAGQEKVRRAYAEAILPIKRFKADDYGSEKNAFIERMGRSEFKAQEGLNIDVFREISPERRRVFGDVFDSMLNLDEKSGMYFIKEDRMPDILTTNKKLASYMGGYKVLESEVESFGETWIPNESRYAVTEAIASIDQRANSLLAEQRVALTAAKEGRIDPSQFPLIFERDGAGNLGFAAGGIEPGGDNYAGKFQVWERQLHAAVDASMRDEEGNYLTLEGIAHNRKISIEGAMVEVANHFGLGTNYLDVIAETEDPLLRTESMSSKKVLANMINVAESEFEGKFMEGTGTVVGAGAQIMLGVMVSKKGDMVASVVGNSGEEMTMGALLQAAKRNAAEAYGGATALAESQAERAAEAISQLSTSTASRNAMYERMSAAIPGAVPAAAAIAAGTALMPRRKKDPYGRRL